MPPGTCSLVTAVSHFIWMELYYNTVLWDLLLTLRSRLPHSATSFGTGSILPEVHSELLTRLLVMGTKTLFFVNDMLANSYGHCSSWGPFVGVSFLFWIGKSKFTALRISKCGMRSHCNVCLSLRTNRKLCTDSSVSFLDVQFLFSALIRCPNTNGEFLNMVSTDYKFKRIG